MQKNSILSLIFSYYSGSGDLNGQPFPTFLTLKKVTIIMKVTMFVDSLTIFKEKLNKRSGLSLSNIYETMFQQHFQVRALSHCLGCEANNKDYAHHLTSLDYVKASIENRSQVRWRVITLQNLPVSGSMKEKKAKEGIDSNSLHSVFSRLGSRSLIRLLASAKSYGIKESKSHEE